MARKPGTRYGHDAVLFLSFDVYAKHGDAEKARRRALRDIKAPVNQVLDALVRLGFHEIRFVPDIDVRETI